MMSAIRLDHINLAVKTATEANEYVQFFTEMLGLHVGPRPPFNFDGYWLYGGEAAIVHISILPAMPDDGNTLTGVSENTGVIDHVAFWSDDYEAFSARLKNGKWRYTERMLPGRKTHQVFVQLPRGLVVEVDLPASAE